MSHFSARSIRCALLLAAGAIISSCAEGPTHPNRPDGAVAALQTLPPPAIVISQVYGGGGNAGATLTNDFIELFNPGASPVTVAGWSVQYASATGTTWQVTALSGTIQPGAYYLVQEAAGAGGTVNLPTPDATGGIAMAAGAGKVFLSSTTTALATTCPPGAEVIDKVSYGASSDCGFGTTGANLTNTTAALRNADGCAYTQVLSADFASGTPNPRNSASPTHSCTAPPNEPASVTVSPPTASITVGVTQAFTAAAFDSSNNPVGTTFTWSSSDNGIATVNSSGVATGVAAGSVTITATAANGVSGTASLSVTTAPPPGGDLVISQVFGGGGNSGSVYTNDFIEIFNRSDAPVSLTDWSVQYTSAAGNGTWQVTALSGTIQPHQYYLVQESQGAGGTTPLPTPDAVGTIAMGGTAGKVILAQQTTALTGACPLGTTIIDRVGYGTNATADGCGSVWGGRTDDLSSTLAAFRLDEGCINTGSGSADFIVQPPAPRNGASATHTCAPPSTATIVINELMADPLNAAGGASWGEWFEVKNTGSTPVDLQGWTISTQGQPNHVIVSSLVVPPGGYKVLGRGADPALNGGITIDYNYFTGSSTTIFLDATDVVSLTDASGGLVDFVRWTSSSTFVKGVTRGVRDATADNTDVAGANWGYSTVTFGHGDFGTPGADNGTLSNTPPAVPNSITFSGRLTSDPPLPIGFEDQLFATLRDGTGTVIPTTFTWVAETPAFASIDQNGVMHSLAPGSATFRATATDGTTATYTLTMAVANASTTAQYGNSTEFGDPADADASDDHIVRRQQFTTSFNVNRGTANWVAYNLDASHFGGGVDRCDCFTYDPLLPAAFPRYTTADYTGAGTFAGYGIDRGHLARSFDRTSGELDNAYTYLFSNIIPQAADLNQGPWAIMENFLGDEARLNNKEVYIVAGVAGDKGTVKNEGKIVIPTQVWKVAVIMPRDEGLADVQTYQDLQVIAVIAPNDPGVRNVDWHTYITTVDAVETLSGYDLLSLLRDNIERAVESNTMPPIAVLDGPYAGITGTGTSMSGSGSVDPNGSIVSYSWSFGDGGVATGANVTHTYQQAGTYNVRLIVTDNDGLVDTATTTAVVTLPRLTALGAAKVWIGLKNSDAVGLRVDLRAEVLVNGAVVGSAEASNLSTGSSGFNNAQLNTLALALLNGAVDVPSGTQISVRPSLRRTCFGGGHNSGRLLFWFNGQPVDQGANRDAGTRFGIVIEGTASTLFVRTANALSTTAGAARESVEVTVNSSHACPSRPFTTLGTWSTTLP